MTKTCDATATTPIVAMLCSTTQNMVGVGILGANLERLEVFVVTTAFIAEFPPNVDGVGHQHGERREAAIAQYYSATGVTIIQGIADAGKTTTTRVIAADFRRKGYTIHGPAQNWKAAV